MVREEREPGKLFRPAEPAFGSGYGVGHGTRSRTERMWETLLPEKERVAL